MAQLNQQQPATEYKAPPPEELHTILQNHGQWLDTNPRGPGGRATLKDYDLRESQLDGYRLEHVVFEHVCLRGRKFENVNLSGCHFVNVDLSGAEFTAVNLAFAQFTEKTDLSDAILAPSALNQTVFSDAILDNTEFRFRMNSKPEHACQFRDCKGSGTLFANAKLNNVEFKRNTLTEGNFQGTQFTNVIFEDGDYRACNFSNIRGEPLRMLGVHFCGSSFQGATIFPPSELGRCIFDDGGASECSFESAVLRGVSLKSSTFKNVNFRNAILDSALLSNSAVDGSDFTACSGLYGRHRAKLENVEGAQNANYGHKHDYCTWDKVRLIGSIPLFGVSYFAIIAICLLVSLTDLYNKQARAFTKIVTDAVTSSSEPAAGTAAHQDSTSTPTLRRDTVGASTSDVTGSQPTTQPARRQSWAGGFGEIELPSSLGHTLLALIALAAGATIYKYAGPAEIQENTEVKWGRELGNPQIEYMALSSSKFWWRWASGIFYFVGATYILFHIIWRIAEAMIFLLL